MKLAQMEEPRKMEKGRVTVFRYNPEKDPRPFHETYDFPFEPGMSVLDVALYIYENIDGSFSFSYCCRNSHCGLCAVKINGQPGLMCRESATREMTLEPLDNLPVIRDLMVERRQYEERMSMLRLFLERLDGGGDKAETIQLEDLDRFKVASRCVECYSCISTCPAFREGRHEFLGPAGLVQLARHAFDPRDVLNREVMAYSAGVYSCTLCGKCTAVCPQEAAPKENIQLLRAQLVAKNEPPRAVKQLIEMVKESEKAVLPPMHKKTFLEGQANARNAPVGLFVGCNMDYDTTLMPIPIAAVKVLLKLGVKLAIPADQVCCGIPLTEVGSHEQLRDLVVKNVEAFKRAGCEQMLTLCSGCGVSAKKLWPDIYQRATSQEMPFEVQDFTEFLAAFSLPGEILQGLKLKITYHDPCLLKDGQGIYEEPRQLLRGIPELDFIEMPEADYCCGGGGGLRLANFEMSKRILKRKMAFVKNEDFEAIVTGCPFCIKQLKIGLSQERRRGVRVLHTAIVIAQAMGLA
jgi:fumarate reductase (CoM/CoB) subunit B